MSTFRLLSYDQFIMLQMDVYDCALLASFVALCSRGLGFCHGRFLCLPIEWLEESDSLGFDGKRDFLSHFHP